MAKLNLLASNGGTLREYPIAPSLKIGRDKTNNIPIDDPRASREHTYLYMVQDGPRPTYFVRDLSSRNGTFVNDQKINEPRRLQSGDRVRVGHTEFEFKLDPAEILAVPGAPAPVAATPKTEAPLKRAAEPAGAGVYSFFMWLVTLALFGGVAFGSKFAFAHLIGRMFPS